MNRNRINSIIVSVLIVSSFSSYTVSCDKVYKESKAEHGELKHIKLTKLRSYQLDKPENIVIGRLDRRFQVSTGGDFFAFYDKTLNQVVLTDSSGHLKRVFGSEGHGPDEFIRVLGFTFSEDNLLYVYDEGQYMVKIFNMNGDLIRTVTLHPDKEGIEGQSLVVQGKSMYFGTIERKYLADVSKAAASVQLIQFNEMGEQVSTFGHYDSYTKNSNSYLYTPILTFSPEEERIYTVQKNSFIVQGWSLKHPKGERVYVTKQKPPAFNTGKEKVTPYLTVAEIKKRSEGGSNSNMVFVAGDYIGLHFVTLTAEWFQTSDHNDKEHYIALFDGEGALVGEAQLPYQLANVVNNRLHLILNDDPDNYEIGVYEIDVE